MTLHIETQTLVVGAVFAYFLVGAIYSGAAAMLSYGFTGRGDKMIPLLFFAWLPMLILRIPYAIIIVAGLAAASIIAGLAWLALWSLHLI